MPPQRIDVINKISGVTYDEAIEKSETFELNGRSIRVINFDALLKNKTASGRQQDLADVTALKRNYPKNLPK